MWLARLGELFIRAFHTLPEAIMRVNVPGYMTACRMGSAAAVFAILCRMKQREERLHSQNQPEMRAADILVAICA